MTEERAAIDRGWYYVVEPDGGRHAAPERRLRAGDGRILTRRLHGFDARLSVEDASGAELPRATWVRAASAVGRVLETRGHTGPLRVLLGPAGTADGLRDGILHLDGPALARASSHHLVERRVAQNLPKAFPDWRPEQLERQPRRAPRVLFFESLMNADLPHNDRELSQGVLHMIASLRGSGAEVALADVKMAVSGRERPVLGLEDLDRALAVGRPDLVCITLLEGYFEGVRALVRGLRQRGCRAHVAVGGVMPTLAPEHVAAHLEDVSFVCRGAGEVHLPALVRLVGAGDVDTPFTPAQRHGLMHQDGLIAFDPGGGLVAGRPARIVEVGDLDRVELDLSWLKPRHIEGGIEIATSRGCVHRCTFCSILGRESYQARSAGSVRELLATYAARFEEIFGSEIPHNAWRVHFCDDDFACDRDRAIALLEELGSTRFQLSSVQVSVADLCRRGGGRLLPEVDAALCDAFQPSRFADAGLEVPVRDYVRDFKSRTWSAYIQVGVESFCDSELVRLGKGYQVTHVRAVAAELSRRHLHWDAYVILSNSETCPEDLIDSLEELCRLKLRHPIFFHARFPVVPRLVSYFTSASHRRLVRQGRSDVSVLRDRAEVEGHPELDYPFVDHDAPADPWVRSVLASEEVPTFFSDEQRYGASLERLRAAWTERLQGREGEERLRGEQLVRRLDDRLRSLVFEQLLEAREADRPLGGAVEGWPGWRPDAEAALATALELLGPAESWLTAFERHGHQAVPRLVLVPTWQCELRCRYCFIPKQDGRVIAPETLDRALELLLSSHRPAVMLQFFGGEALMEWDLLRRAIERGTRRARELGKELRFLLSSNGFSLDEERLDWLSQYPVKLELSLDGAPEVQNRFRRALGRGVDSYARGIATHREAILSSGLDYDVIMVVHPQNVERMKEGFFHIASLGFGRIQVNFALGYVWTRAQQEAFAQGLFAIGRELRQRWAAGDDLVFVNLEGPPLPIRLNGEVTVDWDGTIYGGNAFLHQDDDKDRFRIGHLDDLHGFDRYWLDGPSNETLLRWSYAEEVTRNNLKVGAIFTSFHQWMVSG